MFGQIFDCKDFIFRFVFSDQTPPHTEQLIKDKR